MITQGVRVAGRCGVCGGTSVSDVGQFFERGRLRWGSEGRCEGCADGWCELDSGPVTPEYIRQALLREHGPARLCLAADLPSLVPVLKALRDADGGLSLGEARARAAELVAEGLVGTFVEMEVLAGHMRARDVPVAVGAAGRGR
ncbi:hypothetical protein [Streptomyces sp. NPDC058157]|uniref:hypothetical protein n=1 Tax=Streptomyces sp. NPDC058157 TaxID=3346360 RepID=UPI0036EBD9E3